MKATALFVAISIVIAVWLSTLYHLGIAHAAPAADSDVLGDPLGFYEYLSATWHSGAILNTIIVGSLGVLKVLQARIAWFQQGHRIVLLSTLIGGLSLLADGITNGRTPNASMVMIAIGVVIAAIIPAKHAPAPGGAA